ncbi:MAG: transposase [Phycisphaerae bacterium]
MPNTLGYMLTWTTYGTWLQGDKKRFVKDGQILQGNEKLLEANKKAQTGCTVRFSGPQKKLVRQAILNESKSIGQKILALVVYSNHLHLVAEYVPKPIANIVAYYKKAGRLVLKETGVTGKIWTKGYDVRYCFDRETLQRLIKYVQNHNPA